MAKVVHNELGSLGHFQVGHQDLQLSSHRVNKSFRCSRVRNRFCLIWFFFLYTQEVKAQGGDHEDLLQNTVHVAGHTEVLQAEELLVAHRPNNGLLTPSFWLLHFITEHVQVIDNIFYLFFVSFE